MRKSIIFCGLLLSVISFTLVAAQQAIILKDTSLQSTPEVMAQTVETLAKDSQVTILKRRGAWYQVETDSGSQGWLKMITVRYTTKSGPKRTRDFLSGITETTTSTGVRGLSDDEEDEVFTETESDAQKLDRNTATKEQAESHAQEGGLEKRAIDYQ